METGKVCRCTHFTSVMYVSTASWQLKREREKKKILIIHLNFSLNDAAHSVDWMAREMFNNYRMLFHTLFTLCLVCRDDLCGRLTRSWWSAGKRKSSTDWQNIFSYILRRVYIESASKYNSSVIWMNASRSTLTVTSHVNVSLMKGKSVRHKIIGTLLKCLMVNFVCCPRTLEQHSIFQFHLEMRISLVQQIDRDLWPARTIVL